MKKHFYTQWMILLCLIIGACTKADMDCDPEDEESPCYAGLPGSDNENGGSNSKGECWYKLTLDGTTVEPNKYGTDQIVLVSSAENGEQHSGFRIDQAKTGTNKTSVLIVTTPMLLNTKAAKGNYTGSTFGSFPFFSGAYDQFPYYVFSNEKNSDYPGNITVQLLENSNKRIWAKISGTVNRINSNNDITGVVNTSLEIKIGRGYYYESVVNGALLGGSYCDCQNP